MEKKEVVLTQPQLQEKLQNLASQWKKNKISVEFDAPMKEYTSFKAGGNAAALVSVDTVAQLQQVLQDVDREGITSMLLGNGSNTLFRDSGYAGLVIKLGEGFSGFEVVDGDQIVAGASILLSVLAKHLLRNSLSGFEFASGIPGSLGGAVFMNAGAYGGEIKDVLISATAVSRDGSHVREFSAEELQLSYRHSVLEDNGYIVVSARMQLEKGNPDEIQAKMRELMEKRNSKQPVQYPSAGSTFKRPEGYFAGKLVEDAGLKGVSVGGAQVSVLHSGFLINTGDATATDILDLIKLVQNTVYDKFGVKLEPEVRIIG